MATYTVIIVSSAERFIKKLDSHIAKAILKAIDGLALNPRPPQSKQLVSRLGRRLRIGDYRILYTITDQELIVTVVDVGHRKEVYR